ncbi:hypothetical protein HGH93_23565 [Chitinophaga polysaccharea]|uniref:hypothetical protein n=1 Tax=Chitinophaga polysaccharea TaxID=1293035 RepID=UPI001455C345|nr:hypothetical protein [Chitinophaga polysaccharea]NLR61100.1 hypothetical protein [Chitinophaga polysaccharea]
MIHGTIRRELTLESIFERTSEYEIYRHYLGHDFKNGVPFRSPFHKDNDPSASIIRTGNGRLHFTDFGTVKFSGKVIDFVGKFYPGSNFNQLLQFIDRDLNLGIKNGKGSLNIQKQCDILTFHNETAKLIQVQIRPFNKNDLAYWGMYHLDINDLCRYPRVYAIEEVYIDKVLFPLQKGELAYGYYFGKGRWKIYRPYAILKKDKWRCNISNQLLYGIKSLNPSKEALQIKAVKDYKVAQKFYSNCYGVQHEGINVIGKTDMDYLLTFPSILICNDPDSAGISATEYYLALNKKFKRFEIPSSYVSLPQIKDLADIARYHGKSAVEEIIKKNIPNL